MESLSRAGSPVGRRSILRLTVLTPAAAALTTACTASPQEERDPLETVAAKARSDVVLAQTIARTHADLADKANGVAEARQAHAQAVQQEIDRVNPPDPDVPRPGSPAPTLTPSADGASGALADALRKSQKQATDLVPTLPSYRAGLLGSVSASCASLLEVLA